VQHHEIGNAPRAQNRALAENVEQKSVLLLVEVIVLMAFAMVGFAVEPP
jgi:hypothetical protein